MRNWILCLMLCLCYIERAEAESIETRYTRIEIKREGVEGFSYRMTGKKNDIELLKRKIDEIVERVKFVLELDVNDFNVNIHVIPISEKEKYLAYYKREINTIILYVESSVDWLLAHELTHALLENKYGDIFSNRIEEILANYTEKNLWKGY